MSNNSNKSADDLVKALEKIIGQLHAHDTGNDYLKYYAQTYAKNIYGREALRAINDIKKSGKINETCQSILQRMVDDGPRFVEHKTRLKFLSHFKFFKDFVKNNPEYIRTEELNNLHRQYFEIFKSGITPVLNSCKITEEFEPTKTLDPTSTNTLMDDFGTVLKPVALPSSDKNHHPLDTSGQPLPPGDRKLHHTHRAYNRV